MRVRVEVSGLDEVRDALRDGGRVVAERLKEVLSRKADQVVSLARPLAPVDPELGGQLKASVRRGRANYQAKRGVVSVPIMAGGAPLQPFLLASHHRYNIYAVLQEFDIGRGAPYAHSSGTAHFIERPVNAVASSIPDEMLEAIKPADLGGM